MKRQAIRDSIQLHCIHALTAKRFNPSVLQGREIIPLSSSVDLSAMMMSQLTIEDPTDKKPRVGYVYSIGSGTFLKGIDDPNYYYGAIHVRSWKLKKGDGGKLAVTSDGKVAGIIFSAYDHRDQVITTLVPADAFFNPPAEHMRESLKGIFDAASLADRTVVPHIHSKYVDVLLDGHPRASGAMMPNWQDVALRGKNYAQGWYVHCKGSFAEKTDVGKLVVLREKPNQVIGVVAGTVPDQYGIKTHIVPAWTLLRP